MHINIYKSVFLALFLASVLKTSAQTSPQPNLPSQAGVNPEAQEWIKAVEAMDGGTWSQNDVTAINVIVAAVDGNPELRAARDAKILLIAPFRGPNAASRRRCLYHPSGATIQLGGTLPDAAYQEDGIHGDRKNFASLGFDGSGLSSTNISLILQGRNFETLYCDPTCYLISGAATKINGETTIYHKDYAPTFQMGSTQAVWSAGMISGHAFPSGTIGFISQGSNAKQYRYYHDDQLIVGQAYNKRIDFGKGKSSFKLLSNGTPAGSGANIQTVVICPGLSDVSYLSLQASLAQANEDRSTYPGTTPVTSPFKIWIFAGQSNCSGDQVNVANINNQSVYPDDDSNPHIFQWGRSGADQGKVILASNPLDFNGGGAPVGVGPALPFAKALLAQNPNQRILIIPAAVGATGFSSHNWNPGDKVYEQMVSMVNDALKQGGTIEGMVWNQGEGDSKLSDQQYADAWTAMFNDFKSRVQGGWPDGAVVLFGELANPNFTNISQAIEGHLLASVKRSAFVTKKMAGIDKFTAAEMHDDLSMIHYSARAQRLMGAAYAAAIPIAQNNN